MNPVNALVRTWPLFVAIFLGLAGAVGLFLSDFLIGFGLVVLSALIAFAIYRHRDAQISLSSYSNEINSQQRPERALGQSTIVQIGFESPLLRLPPEFASCDREDAYIESLAGLPELKGRDLNAVYNQWRSELSRHYHNDPNVFIDHPLESLTETVIAHPCDFGILEGFERDFHRRLYGVTGNIVAVSRGGSTLYLLNRGKKISKDAKSEFHIFGGAIDPTFDQGSMARCAEREFREEAGTPCSVGGCPVMLHREGVYAKSMVTFLGAPVDRLLRYESEEGIVHAVDLGDVDSVISLFSEKWVDSGRQAVLVWFALGCPVAGRRNTRISRSLSKLLFERCLKAST